MNETTEYYIDLIARYFAGEATPDEIISLSSWIKETDDNRKLFTDYKKAWELSEQLAIDRKVNLDDEWEKLAGRISASVTSQDRDVKTLNISAVKKKPVFAGWLKLAATLLVLIASASVIYYYFLTTGMKKITAENGILEVNLPDGSTVSLNKGAVVEFQEKFNKNRIVRLKGEACFQVAHDPEKPFIVEGDHANVEVLGTVFNVKTSNRKGNMEVVLTSGKVSLYFDSRPGEKVILNPGEQAELSYKTQSIHKTANRNLNYMSWKTKHIVFDNVMLEDILEILESVYHVDIRLAEPGLATCRVTATFDQQPLSSVLKVLMTTLDLKSDEQGSVFILSGKSCN